MAKRRLSVNEKRRKRRRKTHGPPREDGPAPQLWPVSNVLWHYTTADGRHFGSIVADGVLKPTAVNAEAEGDRPALWFSTEPHWERTAQSVVVGPDGTSRWATFDEMVSKIGVIRFGVSPEVAPHPWASFRRMAGMPAATADALEQAARTEGAHPGNWYATFESVPSSEWTAVQQYVDGSWADVPTSELR